MHIQWIELCCDKIDDRPSAVMCLARLYSRHGFKQQQALCGSAPDMSGMILTLQLHNHEIVVKQLANQHMMEIKTHLKTQQQQKKHLNKYIGRGKP